MTRIRDYFMEHVRPLRGGNGRFFVVTKPLYVFKKVYALGVDANPHIAIANLVIPIAARIHCLPEAFNLPAVCFERDDRKMRASKATVHSVVLLSSKREVPVGWSSYSYQFLYKPGATVTPKYGFSPESSTCARGIHFFLTLTDARYYRL